MSGFRLIIIVCALALAVAGCGMDDDTAQPQEGTTRTATEAMKKDDDAMKKDDDAMKKDGDAMMDKASARPAGEAGLRVAAKQAQIVAKDSEFGRVLFDAPTDAVSGEDLERLYRRPA